MVDQTFFILFISYIIIPSPQHGVQVPVFMQIYPNAIPVLHIDDAPLIHLYLMLCF
jgi:hypothetical protein